MRFRYFVFIFVTIAVLTSPAIARAQRDDWRLTLPELARRHAPDPVFQSRIRELVMPSLAYILPQADVIIHGRVIRTHCYLTADQKDLYTDYEITPLRVIRQRVDTAAARPGVREMPSFVLKRWGGAMTLEGVLVTQDDHDLRAFREGEELLLLLRYDKASGKFVLPSVVWGALAVTDGRIQPLVTGLETSTVFDGVRGRTVADFEAEILRLTR